MSVELVKKAMQKFLADPTPAVLCIEGRWGTGKTYAWDDAVKQSLRNKRMAKTKYAYVSLFGIKDSADILQSVFANTIDLATHERVENLSSAIGLQKIGDLYKKLDKKWKAATTFGADHASVPYFSGLGGVVRAMVSNLVYDTVVCIDDFERKSASVHVNEIMGTIVQLRDARKCKVVLILNENSLNEEEKVEFQRFAEKVIDASFKFEPTPAESASVVFSYDNDKAANSILRSACEELGITNIRVMTKISRYAQELVGLLKDVDSEVVKQILRSFVVIAWSAYSPRGEGAPNLVYLMEKREKQYFSPNGLELTEEEQKWGARLTEYGFSHCDEFDHLMIDDIKNGFLSEDKIKEGVAIYLSDAKRSRAQAALTAAWDPFHASFDNNIDEVANSIFNGCVDNIMYLTPVNLSSAVSVLKDIDRTDQGMELLRRYMESHKDDDTFRLSRDPFGSSVTDPDVIKVFNERAGQIKKSLPTPLVAASRINEGGWSPKDEESLANLSVNDFVAFFKDTNEPDRSKIVFGCLKFASIVNATPRQLRITDNAKVALAQIGQESPLNAHRLKKFCISLPLTQNDRETQ